MINAQFKQTMTKVWHDCRQVTVRFERNENISNSPCGSIETI